MECKGDIVLTIILRRKTKTMVNNIFYLYRVYSFLYNIIGEINSYVLINRIFVCALQQLKNNTKVIQKSIKNHNQKKRKIKM